MGFDKDVAFFTMSQDGILSNATRNPKPYIFEDYDLIQEAIEYDLTGDARTKNSDHPQKTSDSFESWFKSKYFGFVTSRIYNGSMSMEDITQDFGYTFDPKSWSDLEERRNGSISSSNTFVLRPDHVTALGLSTVRSLRFVFRWLYLVILRGRTV